MGDSYPLSNWYASRKRAVRERDGLVREGGHPKGSVWIQKRSFRTKSPVCKPHHTGYCYRVMQKPKRLRD